jgi:nitroimidazol reductase NimA-like FMN-containing flavoprotein (pyridoxamine 5'-phosphate oxidase superfamily)
VEHDRGIDRRTGLAILDRDECLRLLRSHHLGRLGVVFGGSPLVLPVNYAMDGDRVVFRSNPGTKLHGALGGDVAFEIDDADNLYHSGWSVVVTGRAVAVDESDHARLARLPLRPWGPGDKSTWVAIEPVSITGRRIIPAEVARG